MALARSIRNIKGKHTAMNSAISLPIDESLGISQLYVPKHGCWILPRLRQHSCAYIRRNYHHLPSFLPKPLLVDRSRISSFARLMSAPSLPPRGQIISSIRSSCRAAREAANIQVNSLFPSSLPCSAPNHYYCNHRSTPPH